MDTGYEILNDGVGVQNSNKTTASPSPNLSHSKRIFNENELDESSVVKHCLTTAADGKGYQTKHYSLHAIITTQRAITVQIPILNQRHLSVQFILRSLATENGSAVQFRLFYTGVALQSPDETVKNGR